jgi:hypothetical protein
MKRDFGRNVCEDIQAWWFDQLIGGKRYKGEAVYNLIKQQQKIAKQAYEKDRTKNRAGGENTQVQHSKMRKIYSLAIVFSVVIL